MFFLFLTCTRICTSFLVCKLYDFANSKYSAIQSFNAILISEQSPLDQNQDATMFENGEQFGNQDKGNFFM